MRNNIVINQ